MKTTKLIAAMAVSASLALGVAAQAKEKKHEEETIKSSDVPATRSIILSLPFRLFPRFRCVCSTLSRSHRT